LRASPKGSLEQPEEGGEHVAHKEILVVDDDSSARFLMRLILEDAGYLVREAANGLGALILLKDWLPQLIVTDMVMPEMDGQELISRLRSDPRSAAVPILAVTGQPEAMERAGGADAVLAKPLSRAGLVSAVTSLIASS
jgi:CheY-like chemotaxis protein